MNSQERGQDTQGPTVLVIDDVAPILRVLELELKIHGYNVIGAAINERVYDVIAEIKPDVVVMEVFMPQIQGMELLKGIRQRFDVPVIFLTTSHNQADKEEALSGGANDFILKPFQPEELTHRISAVIKAKDPLPRELVAGDVRIDYTRRELYVRGKSVAPTTSEWALLYALGRTPGRFVPAEEVLVQVWGLEGVLNRESLPDWIQRLREKVGDDLDAPKILKGSMEEGFMVDAQQESG